ncbi:conserved hypothetical protein [Limnospira maxima CS-328]|uniref:NERD domain-containing protein n=1 Tax=Limnospira maxima CS-328 TaxID=513049 RepID=B5W259_LIMMA|nr:NERD domain-containing protein [Limnospira maxima]EDZ94306.1 conserved hypothetical protein [Limnospira maxima CS-328]MDC0836733.1 NERD domain-containing protein [Limnoraphis robusta]
MEFHPYEPIDNNSAQNQLWNWLKRAFSSDPGEAYYRYPIFSRTGNLMREPDFLILHQLTGLWILECQGLSINNIESIEGYEWKMKNWHSHIETPVSQAEDQMFAIQNKLNVRRETRGKLRFHFRVVLPNVNQEEWKKRGFNYLVSHPGVVLLKEDLTPTAISRYFQKIAEAQKQPQYGEDEWENIYAVLGGTLPSKPARSIPSNTPKESPVFAIHEVESKLKVLDSTQKKIAFEIPEGPQRLRGLAGTGKTVLLAKRLAKMHIRHPEWDIALVFFTRSLYDQMIELADLYHREMHPDQAEINWKKVKILHAWGGKYRDGFYYRLAKKCGVTPRDLNSALREVKKLGKSEAVTEVFDFICTELQNKADSIPVLYDCLLIDEGQDLPPSFYQLALQTLSVPQRIYWAYDEAQGIGSLIIPTSEQMFGRDANGKLLVDVSGSYPGGILKTHKMKRCYRTPRQLLMTAHALNMGLFRPGGALQGVTNQKNWQDLGYEVIGGDFSDASVAAGKMVTITRTLTESPHPVDSGSFKTIDSVGSLLSVKTFSAEQEEQQWIAKQVKADLDAGFNPWDIIVVALSGNYEKQYLQDMKTALQHGGVPSAIAGVDTDVDYRRAPDIFRKAGCVTVSGIARAKGNEAWKVYACRFQYATEPMSWKNETELHKRNEAFVALTRSRVWCVVTGLDSAIFDELKTAINQYPNFSFRAFNQRSLKRKQGDDE